MIDDVYHDFISHALWIGRIMTEVRYVYRIVSYRIVSNDTMIRDEPIGDRLAVAPRKVFNVISSTPDFLIARDR
jgi:hypothetical protein